MSMLDAAFERNAMENTAEETSADFDLNIYGVLAILLGAVAFGAAWVGVGVVEGMDGFLVVALLNTVVMWIVSAAYGFIGVKTGWFGIAITALVFLFVLPNLWMVGALGIIAAVISFSIETLNE